MKQRCVCYRLSLQIEYGWLVVRLRYELLKSTRFVNFRQRRCTIRLGCAFAWQWFSMQPFGFVVPRHKSRRRLLFAAKIGVVNRFRRQLCSVFVDWTMCVRSSASCDACTTPRSIWYVQYFVSCSLFWRRLVWCWPWLDDRLFFLLAMRFFSIFLCSCTLLESRPYGHAACPPKGR